MLSDYQRLSKASVHKFSKKSRSRLKILGARRLLCGTLRTEEHLTIRCHRAKLSGLRFTHPCTNDICIAPFRWKELVLGMSGSLAAAVGVTLYTWRTVLFQSAQYIELYHVSARVTF